MAKRLAAPLAVLGFLLAGAPAQAYIYWTAGDSSGTVGRVSLDQTGLNNSFIAGASTPVGIAVDASHVYWVNNSTGSIGRANLDGTGVDQSFITGIANPVGVAVDGAHIYWTNFATFLNTSIGRANLDGTGVNQSFITGAIGPGGIAVDAAHIYWTNPTDGWIGRANLDGTGVNQTFVTGVSLARGIAVDSAHIYWAGGGAIGRANLDGTEVNNDFITGEPTDPDGVAVAGGYVYWIDGSSIGRANLDGTGVDQSFIPNVGGAGLAVDGLGPPPTVFQTPPPSVSQTPPPSVSQTPPPTRTVSPPTDLARPRISGAPQAGQRLTCSLGRWNNDPTSYTYQWYRDGTLMAGFTASSYTLGTLDEGTALTCVVKALNAGGQASATSNPVKIPIPYVPRCPAATGTMTGTTIGLIRLGMTRSQARYVYRQHSNRGKQYEDFFCLTPIGVRVGYASPKLLVGLPKPEQAQVRNRVVWSSTSNPFYSLDGVRAGESIATAAAVLGTEPPFHIGLNYWYLARKANYTAVLKVRGGVVEELGIANNTLTTTRGLQSTLMNSFY
jgi:virginiamycin B lyase